MRRLRRIGEQAEPVPRRVTRDYAEGPGQDDAALAAWARVRKQGEFLASDTRFRKTFGLKTKADWALLDAEIQEFLRAGLMTPALKPPPHNLRCA